MTDMGRYDHYTDSFIQEPCVDAVSRVEVLEQINSWIGSGEYRHTNATWYLGNRMNNLPSVQPKVGNWEMCEDADGIYGVCNMCGTDADFTHYGEAYPFCPNCGAKMEG